MNKERFIPEYAATYGTIIIQRSATSYPSLPVTAFKERPRSFMVVCVAIAHVSFFRDAVPSTKAQLERVRIRSKFFFVFVHYCAIGI